ncbi:hypothetical protein MTsN2n4_24180 [Pseudoalteromonas sp. MTN2-4]
MQFQLSVYLMHLKSVINCQFALQFELGELP